MGETGVGRKDAQVEEKDSDSQVASFLLLLQHYRVEQGDGCHGDVEVGGGDRARGAWGEGAGSFDERGTEDLAEHECSQASGRAGHLTPGR